MAREGIPTKRGQHKRTRRYPGIRGRRPDRKAERKLRADARAANRRSPVAQVAHLDALGVAAADERAKLLGRIEAAKAPKPKGSEDTKERRHGKSKLSPREFHESKDKAREAAGG